MTASSRARLAAIDLGTNSALLLVAEANGAGDYRVLDEAREQTRLGQGLDASGRIAPVAARRTLDALARLKRRAEAHGVTELRAVGTAALREAANGAEFIAEARAGPGLDIEVIGPEREAALALRSVRRRFPEHRGPAAIADIGGGSLEVVLSGGGEVDRVCSMPLGAVRLTERHVRSDPIADADWARLIAEIDRTLEADLGPPPAATPDLFGSGGTFTALAALVRVDRERAEGDGAEVAGRGLQGFAFDRRELDACILRLRAATLEERRGLAGLPPDRADIITAGAAAVGRLARHLGATRIRINDGGVRDGLLLAMLEGSDE